MADSTLTALTAAAALDGSELYYTVQAGADRKATGTQISALVLAIGRTITSATSGSVLFVDGSGQLAQDNPKFFWDDTNFILKAGAEIDLLVNGAFVKALYPVYNATGNNWFIGQAGNTTTTGYRNVGAGQLCLDALTSGTSNVALGYAAGRAISSGAGNFALGPTALTNLTTGNDNVAIGSAAIQQNIVGIENTAIGKNALSQGTTGDGNVAIGLASLYNCTASSNVAIGYSAFSGAGSANRNVAIGTNAGNNITSGDYNTLIGGWQGPSGALSSVIALSDGNSTLKLDYGYTNVGAWTLGTDAASPTAQILAAQSVIAGTTDTAGISWTCIASKGTGTAAGGNLVNKTGFSAKSTGSTQHTTVDRKVTVAKGKVLTDNTAVSLFEVALPTLAMCGGVIEANVVCTDGTDMQSFSQTITYSAVNKGAAYTTSITASTGDKSVSAGTIVNTWSILTGTDKVTVQLSCDTSLTPSSNAFMVYYSIKNNSEQATTIL